MVEAILYCAGQCNHDTPWHYTAPQRVDRKAVASLDSGELKHRGLSKHRGLEDLGLEGTFLRAKVPIGQLC